LKPQQDLEIFRIISHELEEFFPVLPKMSDDMETRRQLIGKGPTGIIHRLNPFHKLDVRLEEDIVTEDGVGHLAKYMVRMVALPFAFYGEGAKATGPCDLSFDSVC